MPPSPITAISDRLKRCSSSFSGHFSPMGTDHPTSPGLPRRQAPAVPFLLLLYIVHASDVLAHPSTFSGPMAVQAVSAAHGSPIAHSNILDAVYLLLLDPSFILVLFPLSKAPSRHETLILGKVVLFRHRIGLKIGNNCSSRHICCLAYMDILPLILRQF